MLSFKEFIREQGEKCALYSQSQLKDLEKFADRLLDKFRDRY